MHEDFDVFNFLVTFSCILASILFIKYHWNRRWLYYNASKFDGPFWLPLIGNAHCFLGSPEDFTNKGINLMSSNSDIFRLWLGTDLYFLNSRPDDVEIVLNKRLEKPPVYKMLTGNEVNDSLIVSPVNKWKKNRKLINPTFNPKIINSFQSKFAKNSKILVDYLNDKCQNKLDIFSIIWKTTIEIACETLLDMDRNSLGNPDKAISQLMRVEEIFAQRLFKPWLYPTIFWKLSPLYKEAKNLLSELRNFAYKMIQMKRSRYINDEIKKLQFLNHLISNENKLTEKELFDEIYFMLVASTETTAVTESFVLLVLAIKQEIQEKVYEELYTIFGDSERETNLEDLNRMDYLERVIKETMRLFPTVLVIGRFLDSDLKIDNYIFPKNSTIVVPIVNLHRNPKLWYDPLHFDPDRFLPKETKIRHRCSHIPFSTGPRNCPGIQYAMMSMKTMLSTLVRHYKIVSCNYQCLEDIKMVFNLVTKAHKDFKVVLEKRA